VCALIRLFMTGCSLKVYLLRCCKLNYMLSDNFSVSGVARVLRAHVQRHVMGPLVTKQLSISFAARAGRTVASSQFT